MSNKLIIDEINNIQNALIIPECFEPDAEKIKNYLPDILRRMMIGNSGLADILIACEIFKQWLAMVSHDDIRDCSKCIHKVSTPDGEFSACELWECEYKSKEDKDAR